MSYVDALLLSGYLGFKKCFVKTHVRFGTDSDKSLPITFAGFNISGDKKCSLHLHQEVGRVRFIGSFHRV